MLLSCLAISLLAARLPASPLGALWLPRPGASIALLGRVAAILVRGARQAPMGCRHDTRWPGMGSAYLASLVAFLALPCWLALFFKSSGECCWGSVLLAAP